MSVNHSFLIANDGETELRVNISGLDRSEHSTAELCAHIYATCARTGKPKFTCTLTIAQLAGLYSFMGQYEMIKDRARNTSGEFVQIGKGQEDLVALLQATEHGVVLPVLTRIVQEKFSHDDINTILGRRDSLSAFSDMLNAQDPHSELEWQAFLERNEWIFGYGLRYKYLSILQRECHCSGTDLDGRNSVVSDFLLSDNRYTKLVELKRPDTPLFRSGKNRSESWQLSPELTDAVSQILCQKANWECRSGSGCHDGKGARISETTCDVDCILLIGTSRQLCGTDKEVAIKSKTIELYRRNMRNIEILFFDELFERAKFIVEGPNKAS